MSRCVCMYVNMKQKDHSRLLLFPTPAPERVQEGQTPSFQDNHVCMSIYLIYLSIYLCTHARASLRVSFGILAGSRSSSPACVSILNYSPAFVHIRVCVCVCSPALQVCSCPWAGLWGVFAGLRGFSRVFPGRRETLLVFVDQLLLYVSSRNFGGSSYIFLCLVPPASVSRDLRLAQDVKQASASLGHPVSPEVPDPAKGELMAWIPSIHQVTARAIIKG